MKIMKYYGILPLLLLTLVSCNMEDKGNYDYVDRDVFFPVKLALTFEEDIRAIEFIPLAPVYYEPEFEMMDDYDRYTYSWFATYRAVSGSMERVEVADTRILDLEQFPLNAGSYTLYFEIKDPVYNLQKLTQVTIQVAASPIGAFGVYIMKDVDGNMELDYFKFARATEIPEVIPVYHNLVSTVFDGPVPGKPVAMEQYNTGYDWETFNEEGLPVVLKIAAGCWYFFTDQDIVATSRDFSLSYKHADRLFYIQPEKIQPQATRPLKNYMFYFLNDNQIYGTYAMTTGIGRFGVANRVGGVRISSAGMITGSWYSLVYDEISGEFIYPYAMDGTITSATAAIKESTVLPNKEVIVDKLVEPIAIMQGGGFVPSDNYMQGTMILKHKTLPNTFYLTQSQANGGVPFTWIRPIDPAADIVQTPMPVMSSTYYGNGVYYAKNNNELWYYADGGDTDTPSPLAQRQTKYATLASGEKIVSITPAMYYNAAPAAAPHCYSWITVLANTSNGRYKLYAFSNVGTTPELQPNPVLVLEGEGEAVIPYLYLQYQQR